VRRCQKIRSTVKAYLQSNCGRRVNYSPSLKAGPLCKRAAQSLRSQSRLLPSEDTRAIDFEIPRQEIRAEQDGHKGGHLWRDDQGRAVSMHRATVWRRTHRKSERLLDKGSSPLAAPSNLRSPKPRALIQMYQLMENYNSEHPSPPRLSLTQECSHHLN
jgi:hypothetical protein